MQGIAENRRQFGRQLKGNRFTPDHARNNLGQVAHVKGDVLLGRAVLLDNNKISAVETSARVPLTTLIGALHSRLDVSCRVGECAALGRPEFTLEIPTLDQSHADITEVRGEGALKLVNRSTAAHSRPPQSSDTGAEADDQRDRPNAGLAQDEHGPGEGDFEGQASEGL